MKAVRDLDRRRHTCSICGVVDVWGPTWEWYGSLCRDGREPAVDAKVCGPECKSAITVGVGGRVLR